MQHNAQHPDADLIAVYEGFHALDHIYTCGTPPASLTANSDAEEAYYAALHTQWNAMLEGMFTQKPRTPAGLAVLLLALLHDPEFTGDAHRLTIPGYATWNGYSVPPGVSNDAPHRRIVQLTEHALSMAPELLVRSHPATGEVSHAA